jgi:hypothetical protein
MATPQEIIQILLDRDFLEATEFPPKLGVRVFFRPVVESGADMVLIGMRNRVSVPYCVVGGTAHQGSIILRGDPVYASAETVLDHARACHIQIVNAPRCPSCGALTVNRDGRNFCMLRCWQGTALVG